ncbi:unnamed protein product [Lactuca virosa]|uniref:Uncharacterized protein n=1 Tax=Lactuca virosa TaxID=75947 RepID=A0AAU9MVB7_9ASTR|nr:unnamed protein product [Lactuca virosa]
MATASHPPSATIQIEQPSKLPDFQASVKLKYVKLGYHYLITNLFTLFSSISLLSRVHATQLNLKMSRTSTLTCNYHFFAVFAVTCTAVFGFTPTVRPDPHVFSLTIRATEAGTTESLLIPRVYGPFETSRRLQRAVA